MEVAVGNLISATTGASLSNLIQWHTINWHKAYRTVRRLQMRIVKAIQAFRCCKTASFTGRLKGLSR